MDSRPDSDLDLRQQIAADAAEPEARPTIFLRAGQFFLVPLAIVVSCVAVYLFFQYMVSEPATPKDLIAQIRNGGAVARKHAAHQLVRVLLDQARRKELDGGLVDPVISVFQELPGNEAPTDPVTRGLVGEGPPMRAILARCLALLGDPKAVPVLVKALQEERNVETMAAYIDALGGLRAPESGPVLINLLDHPSTVVRKYAAFNLAAVAAPRKERGDSQAGTGPPAVPEARPHLQRKLKDPREEVRWNAALGLAVFLEDPSGKDVLLQMLDRAYLEKVIGADKKEEYAPDLVKHALTQACLGASRLKDASFSDALKKLEGDPDSDVRAAARHALGTLAKN